MAEERANPEGAEWVALGPAHLARYLFAASMAQGKRVLDAGCGAGYGAALLAAASGGRAAAVMAVDIDAAIVEQAAQRFKGAEFLVDDSHTLQRASGPFDLICNFENIEHLQHPERFLSAAASRLAPDGLLLISTPDRATTPPFLAGRPANPMHVMEWHAAEFSELLARHFSEIEMRVQVVSHAQAGRQRAVAALRQGMTMNNPLMTLLWRKLGRNRNARSWKVLDSLAAGGVADYPIVEPVLAALWGTPHWHVALCRAPRR